jgi:hypothetical protein
MIGAEEIRLTSNKKPFARKQYYVLPKFQNRFMLVMFFQALLIFGGMILPQYRIWTSYIEKVHARQIEQMAAPGNTSGLSSGPVVTGDSDVEQLILMRNSSFFYSSVFIFVTCLVFGFYCSHRLAGPVFKTIRYLQNYREGKANQPLSFRDGDFFHELADEVNSVLQEKKS